MSLNSGFADIREVKIEESDKELIAKFLAEKSVKICPPVGLQGNEQSRDTHNMIMQKRKEFRAKKREQAKK